ncbi:MAG TPA: hypothetical protein VHB73_03365 [Alphaproteobacteria bacterium]|nr:hypothetical protein [Alphaproteobacteria bacterium]
MYDGVLYGVDAVLDHLAGPRDRQSVMQARPFWLEPIAKPQELITPLRGPLPQVKIWHQELEEKEQQQFFAQHNPFASLCAQFRAVARQLGDYVEQPQFPRDLFWCHTPVRAGAAQFSSHWHPDGEVLVRRKKGIVRVGPSRIEDVLRSGEDFTPAQLFLLGVLEAPTGFAVQYTQEGFAENIFRITREYHGCDRYKVNSATFEPWLERNGALVQPPPGLIGFESGKLHKGMPIPEGLESRAYVICSLEYKQSALPPSFRMCSPGRKEVFDPV